jgi:hypothetical protein
MLLTEPEAEIESMRGLCSRDIMLILVSSSPLPVLLLEKKATEAPIAITATIATVIIFFLDFFVLIFDMPKNNPFNVSIVVAIKLWLFCCHNTI